MKVSAHGARLRAALLAPVLFALAPACGARSELIVGSRALSERPPGGATAGCAEVDDASPRLIAPLALARVTRRRPTVRWEFARGSTNTAARVDFCRDRACAEVLESVDAVGTSARPSRDLPAGVAFWRVRSRCADLAAPSGSRAWSFLVPARDGEVDTSWDSMLDADGDGLADVAVGDPSAGGADDARGGTVLLYRGAREGLSPAPWRTLTESGPPTAGLGWRVVTLGDVNGDGTADVLALAGLDERVAPSANQWFFPGGVEGPGPLAAPGVPARAIDPTTKAVSVGDVNGDGYGDWAVDPRNEREVAVVYLGGPDGLRTEIAQRIRSLAPRPRFDVVRMRAGDFDGDGRTDLFVATSSTSDATTPTVSWVSWWMRGRESGTFGPAQVIAGEERGSPASHNPLDLRVGDVNGDGRADVVTGHYAASSYQVRFWLGTPAGPSVVPVDGPVFPIVVPGAGSDDSTPAIEVADFDRDGLDDVAGVVIANRLYVHSTGAPAAALRAIDLRPPGPVPCGQELTWYYDLSVNSPGDLNGDGYLDLVAAGLGGGCIDPSGGPSPTANEGAVWVFYGGPSGFGDQPSARLASGGRLFGRAVY